MLALAGTSLSHHIHHCQLHMWGCKMALQCLEQSRIQCHLDTCIHHRDLQEGYMLFMQMPYNKHYMHLQTVFERTNFTKAVTIAWSNIHSQYIRKCPKCPIMLANMQDVMWMCKLHVNLYIYLTYTAMESLLLDEKTTNVISSLFHTTSFG